MPFHNNVYYPYQSEAPGGQSSAGIPSLLNSPQSQRSSSGAGPASSAAMSSGAPPAASAFRFRTRRDSVDWRRIGAIDVDRVASELDLGALQEHVAAVTFCSVERERCPRCQSPVDPALLKLLRLAQLTVEYLLHSQDVLSGSLRAAEEGLRAAGRERERLEARLHKQAEDARGLKGELRQRKKIIVSQQSVINAGVGGYHKCQCCDKAFMNSSFLQSHMQRRHPEEYDIRVMSEKQRKVQAVMLQEEINKLKEQLNLTRSQLEVHQQAHIQQQAHTVKTSQEQEQRSKEEDMLKHLERWKEEERERLSRQMEEMRDMFLRESKELKTELQQYKTQVNILSELEESGRRRRSLQEEQLQASSEERHRDDVRKLQQLLRKQEEKWGSRMQKTQEEHERERSQLQGDLRRLKGATEEQEASRRRVEEMSWKLQEQRELIASQREQMRQLSTQPPARVAEPTVIVTAPEPKPKPPVTDTSSVSEKKADVKKQPPPPAISALKKNPHLKRELRQALEQTLTEKPESLGVKEGTSRLSKEEYGSTLAKVRSERDRRAKKFPDYRRVREDLSRNLTLWVRERDAGSSSAPEQPARSPDSPDATMRSRSSSLPSRVTQVVSRPGPWPQQAPQPAPRSKNSTLTKTCPPRVAGLSSDEESEGERPSHRPGTSRGLRAAPSGGRVTSVARTAVKATESDSDWTDGSDMDEIDPQQLQRYAGQNGIMGKAPKGDLVKDLSRSLERQLSDRGQRPPGGVAILPERKKKVEEEVREAVKELKYAEIEDEDEDDWDISSLEDKPPGPRQDGGIPVKKSFDSSNTSVWDSSTTGRGQEAGQQKGDTGSTLKSSLVTVSDWSDSDEI
ncbi:hypothetical protein AAFF_G00114640 [Aldrovandia affinis]|uniref:Cilium assembly protein DZIP1 n=1 Tax=Aldrovandia affinis TaxID=143900 RepID=A0AAD7WAQ5_9TELE|nr:hypothetical protein AAFF_G00114640 [Aldrovandia affinis]